MPVPKEPSPKSHAYDAIEPSESLDPLALTATVAPDTDDVNEATGAAFPETGDDL